jgi:hypothetical protein
MFILKECAQEFVFKIFMLLLEHLALIPWIHARTWYAFEVSTEIGRIAKRSGDFV